MPEQPTHRPAGPSALIAFAAAGLAAGLALASITVHHASRVIVAAPTHAVAVPSTSVTTATTPRKASNHHSAATTTTVSPPAARTAPQIAPPRPARGVAAPRPATPPIAARPLMAPRPATTVPTPPHPPATQQISAMQIVDRYAGSLSPAERTLYAQILADMTPSTLQMALANLPHASSAQLQLLQVGLDFDMQLPEPYHSSLIADLEGRLSPAVHQQLYAALFQIVASNARLSAQIAGLQSEVQASGQANVCSLGGGTTVFTYRGAYVGCLP
jgi:hypothetical protein